MNTILGQALQLTVLGMGMTFASIGALALGMFLMTRIRIGKRSAGPTTVSPSGAAIEAADMTECFDTSEDIDQGTAQAAAAAVAVALIEDTPVVDGAAQAAAAAVAVALAGSDPTSPRVVSTAEGTWNSFVRSMHLSRRARYEARRVRG